MNIRPSARRILCFGDSNTWGYIPGSNYKRYDITERWTGVLQKCLGYDYEVIEEGLNGRTTIHESPNKAGKNGIRYLYPCLESHNPLDFIILYLGKNDLKAKYKLSPDEIAAGLQMSINIIKKEARNRDGNIPRVLILSVAEIKEKRSAFVGANKKSKRLVRLYQEVSIENDLDFLDINDFIKVGSDGVHLSSKMHEMLAIELANKIIGMKY